MIIPLASLLPTSSSPFPHLLLLPHHHQAALQMDQLKRMAARTVSEAQAVLAGRPWTNYVDPFLRLHTDDVVVEDGTQPGPVAGRTALRELYTGLRAGMAHVALARGPVAGLPGRFRRGSRVAWRGTVFVVAQGGCRAAQGTICSQRVTEWGLVEWHACYYADPQALADALACASGAAGARGSRPAELGPGDEGRAGAVGVLDEGTDLHRPDGREVVSEEAPQQPKVAAGSVEDDDEIYGDDDDEL